MGGENRRATRCWLGPMIWVIDVVNAKLRTTPTLRTPLPAHAARRRPAGRLRWLGTRHRHISAIVSRKPSVRPPLAEAYHAFFTASPYNSSVIRRRPVLGVRLRPVPAAAPWSVVIVIVWP